MVEPIEQGFRTSPQQRRVWRLQEDGLTCCASRCILRIEGDLDRPALRRALAETVARHEILRTAFRLPAGLNVPLQVILEPGPVSLPEIDLESLSPERRAAGAAGLLSLLSQPPFDLGRGEGWRAALVRLGPGEHELLLALSAACADGGTFEPLAAGLLAAYARQVGGEKDEAEPPLQYADIAEWQNSLLEADDTAEAVAAWRERWRVRGIDAQLALPLPLEERMAAAAPFTPQVADVPLAREVAGALARLAGDWGCSLPALLLTAWNAVIQRGSGRDESLVGVLYAGRDAEELRDVVGPLARYLPVAVRLDPAAPLREAVTRAREAVAEAEGRGEYFSWDRVSAEAAGFPLCFEATGDDWELAAAGLRVAPVRLLWNRAVVDGFALDLSCRGSGDDLRLALRYDPRRFRREQVQRLAGRLSTLLGSVAARPEASLADHPAMPEEELSRWLELSAAPQAASRGREGKTLHAVFEQQADRTPDRLALVAGDGRLTFRNLDSRANRLAHHLRAAGAGPEVPVALCLERSAASVTAILAVWKAGAAYVPLDPGQPAERLAFLLGDTGTPLLVADSRLAANLPDAQSLPGVRTVWLDQEAAAIAARPVERPASPAGPHSLAYTIYTSGSTGRPKGVQVEHRSALHLLGALEAAVLAPLAGSGLLPDPLRASLNAPMIFDASVQQLVLLLAGHTLCVVPEDVRADGAALLAFLREKEVHLLDCTPSQLRLLVDAGLLDGPAGPRIVLTAGEAVDEPLWRRLAEAERTVSFNLYGPTECSVDATCHRIGPSSAEPTIGRPLAGYEVFLLDRTLQPVPPGAPGELCLGGEGLARGYLCRPDLTAERFVPHSFSRRPGERLYRSGDLGRHRPDGNLEFLGRLDHQVKIRGYRIELGEIEAALVRLPVVREAVVLARQDAPSPRLVAYVVPTEREEASPAALRAALLARLPAYMVPAAWMVLPSLPLTPNGKVDRRALPEPEAPAGGSAHAEPCTPAERVLAAIWGEVLQVPRVGLHDNFFSLGGDSILSIQICARAQEAGVRIRPRLLFKHQTVAELAGGAQDTAGARADHGPATGPVPLTPIQHQFFASGPVDPHHFNQSVLLEEAGRLDPGRLAAVLALVSSRHETLWLRFRRGLSGWEQEGLPPGEGSPLTVADLSALPPATRIPALEAAAAAVQASLDLGRGPLQRPVFFACGPESPGRFLWVIHHLAVDGVSWRVLLEDLAAAYDALEEGRPASFPVRTTPFRRWAERLAEDAATAETQAELEYWLDQRQPDLPRLPRDLEAPAEANTLASQRSAFLALDTEETRALLQEVPQAYNTQINDVLLTALALAFQDWTGSPLLPVDLEGHGREDLFSEIDLTRTVGWFTVVYPVLLDLRWTHGVGEALKAVKEQLRKVPRGGVGYGLLSYRAAADRFAGLPVPEVSFNYLGQLDQVLSENLPFRAARESPGPVRSPRALRPYLLDIQGSVFTGRLSLSCSYSASHHRPATIEELVTLLGQKLRDLIDHCRHPEAGGFTTSDFPLAGLTQAQLDSILGGGKLG